MSYLPENYPASLETVTFQEALQPEVETMWDARNGMLAQLDPRKATWGLDLYEAALAIKGTSGLDLETRRRQVIAKLQGMGPTTVPVVQLLAETLTGVPCEVIEVYDEYRFEIHPDPDSAGGTIPPRALQLRDRLEEIIPAHLGWQLVVTVWLEYAVGMALGPRRSRIAPLRMEKPLPGIWSYWGLGLGPRGSAVTPDRWAKALPGAESLWAWALGPRKTTGLTPRRCLAPPGRIAPCAVWLGGPVSRTALRETRAAAPTTRQKIIAIGRLRNGILLYPDKSGLCPPGQAVL